MRWEVSCRHPCYQTYWTRSAASQLLTILLKLSCDKFIKAVVDLNVPRPDDSRRKPLLVQALNQFSPSIGIRKTNTRTRSWRWISRACLTRGKMKRKSSKLLKCDPIDVRHSGSSTMSAFGQGDPVSLSRPSGGMPRTASCRVTNRVGIAAGFQFPLAHCWRL